MGDDDTQTQQPPDEGGEDLKAKFEAMQARLAASEAEKEKKDKEARQHQRRADRLQSQISRISRPRRQGLPGARRQQVAQRTQQQNEPEHDDPAEALADFANEQAKENMLLREVMDRGLTLDDVEGMEFDSPAELRAQLNDLQQRRKIEHLEQEIQALREGRGVEPGEEGGEPPSPEDVQTSQTRIDTGGATGTGEGGSAELQAELEALDGQARELRGRRMHREAAWVALRKAHSDPKNVIPLRKQ